LTDSRCKLKSACHSRRRSKQSEKEFEKLRITVTGNHLYNTHTNFKQILSKRTSDQKILSSDLSRPKTMGSENKRKSRVTPEPSLIKMYQQRFLTTPSSSFQKYYGNPSSTTKNSPKTYTKGAKELLDLQREIQENPSNSHYYIESVFLVFYSVFCIVCKKTCWICNNEKRF